MRLATDPLTVIEDEPFVPAVIVNPAVVESVSVPDEADRVTESELAPGLESATVMAFPFAAEKTSVPLMPTAAEAGAVIVGALTVSATLFDADSLSAGSAIEIVSEARPEKPEVG